MTDSPLDSSTASLLSATHPLNDSTTDSIGNSSNGNNSVYSSLPSLPSLPPLDIDPPSLKPPYTLDGSIPSSNEPPSSPINQRASLFKLLWGHLQSCGSQATRFMFKDNNLPLVLNILGHILAAKQLCRSSAVTRYTQLRSSDTTNTTTTLVTDLFRNLGVLHLAQAVLAALALKERRLSTERTALWVLAFVAWSRSLLQTRATFTSPSLYTLAALQEGAVLNSALAIITTIALRNTIKRTGRLI